jgi:hypothetical protein
MKVFADNSLVWEGSVGEDALSFDGPLGMRSDKPGRRSASRLERLWATIFTRLPCSGIRVSAS